jgi:hypothetical protein
MKSFTNNSFTLKLSSREIIFYKIINKDAETGIIEISLSFEDISKIS